MIHDDDLLPTVGDALDELLAERASLEDGPLEGGHGWPGPLAVLVAASGRPADPGELAAEDRIVTTMVEVIARTRCDGDRPRRRGRTTRRILAAKTTAVAVIALGVATAAASVTVNLVVPDSSDDQPHLHPTAVSTVPTLAPEGEAPQTRSRTGPCGLADQPCSTEEPGSVRGGLPVATTTTGTEPRATDGRADRGDEEARRGSTTDSEPGTEVGVEVDDAAESAGSPVSTVAAPADTSSKPQPPVGNGPPSGHGPADPGQPGEPGPPAGRPAPPVPPTTPEVAQNDPPDGPGMAGTSTSNRCVGDAQQPTVPPARSRC